MNITINGESKSFPNQPMTIVALLKECKVENPQLVSVQHNGNFVDQGNYETEVVQNNDEVDFLYFLGGGR
jgi:sulfur carrier protein